jgi:hypothetical protein
MSAGIVVLLTSTIAPKAGMSARIRRSDAAVRLSDYAIGLRFWLELRADWLAGIVFADNSGHSLRNLEKVADSRGREGRPVEFLSFDDAGPPEGLHYGHSEFKVVRDAVGASRLIAGARHVIKATGRYTFPDIPRLIARLPGDFKVAVDSRRVRPFTRHSHMLTQFALAIFEPSFFRDFLWDIPERMVPAPPWNRSQFVETVLYDRLIPRLGEPGVILRWPCNCEPRGVGSNGDSYSSGRMRVQAALRALCRVAAPGIWI